MDEPDARDVGREAADDGSTATDGDPAVEPFDADLTPAITRQRTGEDVGQLASIDDVEELLGPVQTLEPSIQVVWILQSAISATFLGLVSGVAFALLPVGGAWVGGGIFTAVFLVGVVFAVLRYRSWQYQVRRDSLYLERGVITHVTTVVPYVRIQHVDARRGPIERLLGLATTVVYTAGSRGADVSIPGLTPQRAQDLQQRLKQLAIVAEGDDAV